MENFMVIICIKLCTLHASASAFKCKDCPYNGPIYLIERDYHKHINNKFMEKCHLYDFVRKQPYTEGDDVMDTINVNNNYGNVINLFVKDYYNYNINYLIDEGIAFAGELDKLQENKVCVLDVNSTSLNRTDQSELITACTTSETESHYVKMTSESITHIDSGSLYVFLMNFKGFEETYDDYRISEDNSQYCSAAVNNSGLNTVLICSEDTSIDTINIDNTYTFRIKSEKTYCDDAINKYKDKLLAVITASPSYLDNAITVPTIFYNAQYLTATHLSMFPNSLTLNKWQMLKYVYMKFMEIMDWRRVAIISDDSPYSNEFEEQLTQLFRDKRIMFSVKHLRNKSDVNRVIQSLDEDHTKIIIANIDDKYSHQLSANVRRHQVWIIRDELIKNNWKPKFGSTYSIALGPSPRNQYLEFDQNSDRIKILESIERIKIIESIELIKSVYENVCDYEIDGLGRKDFYKTFTKMLIKNHNLNDEQMGFVWTDINRKHDLVSLMNVTSERAYVKLIKHKNEAPIDVPYCMWRSNNYAQPCSDIYLVIILLVFVLFFIMLLVTTAYFDKTSPLNARRRRRGYRCL